MRRHNPEHLRWLTKILFVFLVIFAVVFCNDAQRVAAVAQGDGRLIYGEGTVVTPRTRSLTGTTWSTEASLTTAGAAVRYTITRGAPTRDELIAGVVNASGLLTIYRWNGTTWSSEWTVTTGLGATPRFDIAYEQSSGRALVVYSGNVVTTNELRYRIWNGTSWTAAANLDAQQTSNIVQSIRLASRSGTNEIALAWGDTVSDLSANYWDGSNSVWKTEPAATLEIDLTTRGGNPMATRNFDLIFESSSGELMVAWGNDVVDDLKYVTRTAGVNGTWGSVTTNTSFGKQPLDIQLAAEPGTDYIAYANMSDFDALGGADGTEAAIWSGGAWVNINLHDATVSASASSLVRTSVTWMKSGAQSRAVVVYDDNAAAGVDWLFFNKNTLAWSATQTDYTAAPAPSATGAAGSINIYTNPYNSAEATYMTVDGGSDIFSKKLVFDGTNFTWSSIEGGAALETTVSNKNGWAASFAYHAYVPPAGSLGVDIVDAAGTTVASPSLAMSGTSSSGACQTSTGTLGVSAQKIRTTNTTATPGWSLSIAATGGVTANWSSGTATYDFNDATGSPAGCADGADADSLAGQLSINPSAGTVTPQAGCTNTGVSLGSSAAFAQGTTDSITIASASASAQTNCYWDITGLALSQQIPALQAAGSYSLNMTLTVVAN
ncbi:MAG TPA: hypothetical protein VFZ48_03090 [Candidatus Saccharimonadales bacterium]